jgi:hypothetical protein
MYIEQATGFNPKIIGQIYSFDHALFLVHYGMTLSFSHSIILWSISSSELPFNSLLYTKICKLI